MSGNSPPQQGAPAPSNNAEENAPPTGSPVLQQSSSESTSGGVPLADLASLRVDGAALLQNYDITQHVQQALSFMTEEHRAEVNRAILVLQPLALSLETTRRQIGMTVQDVLQMQVPELLPTLNMLGEGVLEPFLADMAGRQMLALADRQALLQGPPLPQEPLPSDEEDDEDFEDEDGEVYGEYAKGGGAEGSPLPVLAQTATPEQIAAMAQAVIAARTQPPPPTAAEVAAAASLASAAPPAPVNRLAPPAAVADMPANGAVYTAETLPVDMRASAEQLFMAQLCVLNPELDWGDDAAAAFPMNTHAPGTPQAAMHDFVWTADFRAACTPLMAEFPTLDAANKAWDALQRAHKDRMLQLMRVLLFLLTRVYYPTRFRKRAPIAFHSFVNHGLRAVLNVLLGSNALAPPAGRVQPQERNERFMQFVHFLAGLQCVQLATLDLLEQGAGGVGFDALASAPSESLFEVLESTLMLMRYKSAMRWNEELDEVLRFPMRDMRRSLIALTENLYAHPMHQQHYNDARAQIAQVREQCIALNQRHEAKFKADAQARQRPPPAQQHSPMSDDVQIVEKFILKVPRDEDEDDEDEEADEKKTPMPPLVPMPGVNAAPPAGDSSGDVEPGDVNMADAPLPPEQPPPPDAQMPGLEQGANDDLEAEAGSSGSEREDDEVREALGDARQYDEESVEGRGRDEDADTDDDEAAPRSATRRLSNPPPGTRRAASDRDVSPDVDVGSDPPSASPASASLADPLRVAVQWMPPGSTPADDEIADVESSLLQQFLAFNGLERMLRLMTRCCGTLAEAQAQAQAPPQPAAPPANADGTATSSAPAAPATSSAPVIPGLPVVMLPTGRDFPPILHSNFADRIVTTAAAQDPNVQKLAQAHLQCPPLSLLRRISYSLNELRPHLHAFVLSTLLVRLFGVLAPRLQFLPETALKAEPSSGIYIMLGFLNELFENSFWYPVVNGRVQSRPLALDSWLPQVSKEDLELMELELGVRLLRCTFLDKRIQGLRILHRFLEKNAAADKDSIRDKLTCHMRAVVWAGDNPRRMPAIIVGARAADALVQHRLIELLFGEQMHMQLLKRSTETLCLLAGHDALSAPHIELMFASCRGKHESELQAIYHIIGAMAKELKARGAVYLYRRIHALPLAQYDRHLITLIKQTTSNLLGNWACECLWQHTHARCRFACMKDLWDQHETERRSPEYAAELRGCWLSSLPGFGVPPDSMAAGKEKSLAFLTHSAATPRLAFDDYPPDAIRPAFDEDTLAAAAACEPGQLRPAKNDYFGLDLLWRAFNFDGAAATGDGGLRHNGLEREGDPPSANGNSNRLLGPHPLPAVLRDLCFQEVVHLLTWPEFYDPRPSCARRLEFIDRCFGNLLCSRNVLHSLQLMRPLIESFASPSMHNTIRSTPSEVGRNWDDRPAVAAWLEQRRGGLLRALFADLTRFSQTLLQRNQGSASPEAEERSLAFWQGANAQMQARLEFIAFFLQLKHRSDVLAAQAAAAQAATAAADQNAPMADAAAPVATANGVSAPGAASAGPAVPVVVPSCLEFGHVAQLFREFLLCPGISDNLRDDVFRWLQASLSNGVMEDALLERTFAELVPQLNVAHFSPVALQFVLAAFKQINQKHRTLAPTQRPLNAASRRIGASPLHLHVLAYPLVGMEHLWAAALHAHNSEVSKSALHALVQLHTSIDASLRGEINVRYEEAIARCMNHVRACTQAIQASGQPAQAPALSVSELVAELGRGFSALNAFLSQFEGVKPLSHEARLKQATAPPPAAAPAQITAPVATAAPAAAASSSLRGDSSILVDVKLVSSDIPRFTTRMPAFSSVRELKLAYFDLLGIVAPTSDAVVVANGRMGADSETLASLNVEGTTVQITLRNPALRARLTTPDFIRRALAAIDAHGHLGPTMQLARNMRAIAAADAAGAGIRGEEKEEEEKVGHMAMDTTSGPAAAGADATAIEHPASILSRAEYFQQLFDLLTLQIPSSSSSVATARSSHVAEHAWRLLSQLPTNALLLHRLKALSSTSTLASTDGQQSLNVQSSERIDWDVLLPRHSLHQLHYSLQIVFSIIPHHSQPAVAAASSDVALDTPEWNALLWERAFVARGGLRHLITILVQHEFSLREGGLTAVAASPVAPSPMPGTPTSATPAQSQSQSQCQQTLQCLSLLIKIIRRFTQQPTQVKPTATPPIDTPMPPSPPPVTNALSAASPALKPVAAHAGAPAADAAAGAVVRKRPAPAETMQAGSPKRRAIDSALSESFVSELQSAFTLDVVRRLFQLWLEVAAMPPSDEAAFAALAAAVDARDPIVDDEVSIIGPTLPRNNASKGAAAAAAASPLPNDVLSQLVRDTLQVVADILARESSAGIAHQFFFAEAEPHTLSQWLLMLLTSPHGASIGTCTAALLSIARFWFDLPQSPLAHLSRHLFHVVLDMLLSPSKRELLLTYRLRSSRLMMVPRLLLASLQTELVASVTETQFASAGRWSPSNLLPLSEAGSMALKLSGVDLLMQLFAAVRSYPSQETFGSAVYDETLCGYLELLRALLEALTVVPPPKVLPALPAAEEKKENGSAAPRVVHVLPRSSPLSSLVQREDWLSFVYNELLFQVRDVRTPLDVPDADELPRCKTRVTRFCAFNLLKALAQTSQANFHHLQRLLLGGQRNRSDEQIGNVYAPESMRKKHGEYVGLVNQGATCYMNSLMQQLYMIPEFRFGILAQLSTDAIADDAERADSLLYQLQSIFANLQVSDRTAFDAACFCAAYKDYDGVSMNPSLQMDVNEFFNVLFEKLEESLKGSPHAGLLEHVFGGKLSNQLLGRESGCSHTRTRDENFFILSLDVKGKKSVQESLQAFVAGEMLDGDNKFQCATCQRKVDTLKRVCIQTPPNNLILHLKRFDFDLDNGIKIKINDHFEFPSSLDIFDFTVEGLELQAKKQAEKEAQEAAPGAKAEGGGAQAAAMEVAVPAVSVSPAVDLSDYQYELAGVIVHMGTAGSGHYYSYVLERCPLPHQDHSQCVPQWYCFNDTRVEPFNISQLGEQCFGGSTWEGGEAYQRPYSGYMLFYQKRSHTHRPHAPLKCPLPRGVTPMQDAEMREQQALAVAEVAAHLSAPLPTAKETFAPLAKQAGVQIEDASEKKSDDAGADVAMSDSLPADAPSAPGSVSSTSSHKRKHEDAGDESKDNGEEGESVEEAEAEALSPEDEHRRLLCAQYRTEVANGPVDAIGRCVTTEEANALLPWRLFSSIWRANTELACDVFHFDTAAIEFTWHYAVLHAYDFTPDPTDRTWSKEKGDRMQMLSVELALHFLVDTLLHARAKVALPEWDADLRRMLEGNVAASRYFLDYLAAHMDLMERVMLHSNLGVMKKGLSAAVLTAMRTVRPIDGALLLSYEHPPPQPKSKRQRTGEQGEAAEDSSAEGDEEEEEDEDAEVPDEVDSLRPTATGRFLGALLSVSPITLVANYNRLSQWWSLVHDIACLGVEEAQFMLLKTNVIVRVVQSLLGIDCAVALDEDYAEDQWPGLKKLRVKRKGAALPIRSMMQLIAVLLPHACVNGRLSADLLYHYRDTRKALEDVNGFWDLLCQLREELDVIAPVATIARIVACGQEKFSMKLAKKLVKLHEDETLPDLPFTLAWLAGLVCVNDAFQAERCDLILPKVAINIAESVERFPNEAVRCVQWFNDLLANPPSEQVALLCKQHLLHEKGVLNALFILMGDKRVAMADKDNVGWRKYAYDLLRTVAQESPEEAAEAAAPKDAAAMEDAAAEEAAEGAEESEEEDGSAASKEQAPESRRVRIYHVALKHLHRTLSRDGKHAELLGMLPRCEFLWQLLRVLCHTRAEKELFFSADFSLLEAVRFAIVKYNVAGLAVDPARAELMKLLEHLMFEERPAPPGGWDAWFARFEEEDAPAMADDPILAEINARPDWVNRSPLLSAEPIASVVTLMAAAVPLVQALADTSVTLTHSAAGAAYVQDTFPRVWRILHLLVLQNPALYTVVSGALTYYWLVKNGGVREHAFFPKIAPIVFDPNGLFCLLLRLSDEATQGAGAGDAKSFRHFCLTDFWIVNPKQDQLSHHLQFVKLSQCPLDMQLRMALLLLRPEGTPHAEEDAAHFVTTPCCRSFITMIDKLPTSASKPHAQFADMLRLMHRVLATRAGQVREALHKEGQLEALLPAHVLRSCRDNFELFSPMASFLVWLLHWWELPSSAPAPSAAPAAAAPKQQTLTAMFKQQQQKAAPATPASAAAPAGAAAGADLLAEEVPFPGVDAVVRLPPSSRQPAYDVLLCAVAAYPGSAHLLVKGLLEKREPQLLSDRGLEGKIQQRTQEKMRDMEAERAGNGASAAEATAAPARETEEAKMSDDAPAASAESPLQRLTRPVVSVYGRLTGREHVLFVCDLVLLSLPAEGPSAAKQLSRLLTLTLQEYCAIGQETGVTEEDLLRVADLLARLHSEHVAWASHHQLRHLWPRLLAMHPALLRSLDAFALEGLTIGGRFVEPAGSAAAAPRSPETAAKLQRVKASAEWKLPVAELQAVLSLVLERMQRTLAQIASLDDATVLAALHAFSLMQRALDSPPPAGAAADDVAATTAAQERQRLREQLGDWLKHSAPLRANADVRTRLTKASEPLRAELEPTLQFLFA